VARVAVTDEVRIRDGTLQIVELAKTTDLLICFRMAPEHMSSHRVHSLGIHVNELDDSSRSERVINCWCME
jgi:hypothetical protein